MTRKVLQRVLLLMVFALTPALAGRTGAASEAVRPAFLGLKSEQDVLYLLASSTLVMGSDVNGPGEEVVFTGTVTMPRFPLPGYERRRLADGRFQVDFSLIRADLYGESFLTGGTLHLADSPDHISSGTITQRAVEQEFPSDLTLQRHLVVETPRGPLHNREPIRVRATIDAIPPLRRSGSGGELDVLRGEPAAVAMLDEHGRIGAWLTNRPDQAFAVAPAAIYQEYLAGLITLESGGQRERVAVEGPIEILDELDGEPGRGAEIVKLALRGDSRLLGGPILVAERFAEAAGRSTGTLGVEHGKLRDGGRSAFDLHLEIRSPGGTLQVQEPIRLAGVTRAVEQNCQLPLGDRSVPVYSIWFDLAGTGAAPVLGQDGRPLARLVSLQMATTEVHGRRPCCPRKVAPVTAR
jgi:uncharacterized protein DUF6004